MGASQYCYFGNQNPRTFKLCIKISSAEIVNPRDCKHQSREMAKHTQTIRWQIADELSEWVWPLC